MGKVKKYGWKVNLEELTTYLQKEANQGSFVTKLVLEGQIVGDSDNLYRREMYTKDYISREKG